MICGHCGFAIDPNGTAPAIEADAFFLDYFHWSCYGDHLKEFYAKRTAAESLDLEGDKIELIPN